MSQLAVKAIKLLWRCNRPNDPMLVQFIERCTTTTCELHGMDKGIIRFADNGKEPHGTTKVAGKWVKTTRHITANLLDTATGTGISAHIYVDSDNTQMLQSTDTQPNPETWPLTPEEAERDIKE